MASNPMQQRAVELTRDLVLSKLPVIGEPERDAKGVHFKDVTWKWEPPSPSWDVLLTFHVHHMTAAMARRRAAELLLAAEISDAITRTPLGPALERMDYVRRVLAELSGEGTS